jgi:hypothetical protein
LEDAAVVAFAPAREFLGRLVLVVLHEGISMSCGRLPRKEQPP